MDAKVLEQLKDDLKHFSKLPDKCTEEIVEMGYNYITSGLNKNDLKKISATAGNVDVTQIEKMVAATALLLLQLHKNIVSEENLENISRSLHLPAGVATAICSVYKRNKLNLSNFLRGCDYHSTHYKNLQWRLESQLASRSLRAGYQPTVVLNLSLERMGKEENVALVSDIPNIIHWNKMVEEALSESRTQHSRRIQRSSM